MAEESTVKSMLYQSLGMFVICGIVLLMWGIGCRNRHLVELETPLLAADSMDHRIDAATREAEAGFTVCLACAFENFKRFTYCTLCGEKLPLSSDETEEKTVHSNHINIVTPRTLATLNQRQRRARKRREWTRKLDVEGQLFWYRSAANTGAGSQFPGYIVTFNRLAEKKEQEQEKETATATGQKKPEVHPSTKETLQSVLQVHVDEPQDLFNMDSSVSLQFLNASTANPSLFPTGEELVATDVEQMKEMLDFTASDFPTKYAHFVVSTASLLVPAEVEFLKLSVHRDYILEESMDHLHCIKQKNIRSFMRINFLDESGVDAGGVHREWFQLLNDMLVDPLLGLFTCTNKEDQSYYLNPNSPQDVGETHLTYYFATGRLVGRALLEGFVWGFHLSLPLLKMILGMPVTFSDMEYFDPETHKSMVWLLENDGVEALGLDFSMTEMHGDEIVIVDLIPNGRNIDVTDANKHEYLDRKFKYMLFERVSDQLYSFLRGVYEVIPLDLLVIFDPEELDFLLCGTQEIDVEDWKANTVNSVNLNGASVLRWFWEIVTEMPNEYRRRLLLFTTGSSRVPLSGFHGLTSYDGRLCPFTLKGVSYYSTQYICSHACFNRLELPFYRSKRELKTVLYATLDTDLYGFTTA